MNHEIVISHRGHWRGRFLVRRKINGVTLITFHPEFTALDRNLDVGFYISDIGIKLGQIKRVGTPQQVTFRSSDIITKFDFPLFFSSTVELFDDILTIGSVPYNLNSLTIRFHYYPREFLSAI